MIARIFILIIFIIVLPDLYLDICCLRRKKKNLLLKRFLLWMPTIVMILFTLVLTRERNFAPDDINLLYIYLLLLGVYVIPKAIYALSSAIGLLYCRIRRTCTNYGHFIGIAFALFTIYVVIYGSLVGVNEITVRYVDVYSKDLPKTFDEYKIVQFTDAHVGSFVGKKSRIFKQAVDSILSQKPDVIVFTGDLQNIQPTELHPFLPLFKKLKAKDGVFSVLGNHDYSMYIKASESIKVANEREMVRLQRRVGWNLLLNEHSVIRRGNDSIVIAGEENDGRPPFPSRADIHKTLQGIRSDAYVILLQHDPSAWRRNILPHSHVQLTLSGHTHGGQVSLLGLRPTWFSYREDCGLYYEQDRALFVSSGLGGVVPFRFGVPPEIVVITLRSGSRPDK